MMSHETSSCAMLLKQKHKSNTKHLYKHHQDLTVMEVNLGLLVWQQRTPDQLLASSRQWR